MPLSVLKKSLLFIISLFLLFFSFYNNQWKVAPEERYEQFEPYGEAHIVGKLARAEKDGVFYRSGFLGVNYDKNLYSVDFENDSKNRENRPYIDINYDMYLDQLAYYTEKKDLTDGYYPYLSFTGGQGIVYSSLSQISPFNKDTNYILFRVINCALLAFCLLLFFAWVYRSFGLMAATITFILTFLSQWIVLFCGNGLWWALWSFFLPFIVPLLLLEKQCKNPHGTSDMKIFLSITFTIFLKCFFTGFEFITTTLCIAFCPIIYYHILRQSTLKEFILFTFKSGIAVIGGLLIYMLVYILQLSSLFGDLCKGIEYLIDSYSTRTEFSDDSFVGNIIYILATYFGGESFSWGFLQFGFKFKFIYTLAIIAAFGIIMYLLTRNIENRKYKALLTASFISLACPLSWYLIFRQHATWHIHLDYIVWYMPTLLLGFAIVGVGVSLIVKRIKQ